MELKNLFFVWDGNTELGWGQLIFILWAFAGLRCLFSMGPLLLWATRSPSALRRRVYQVQYRQGQLFSEFRYVLTNLVVDAVVLAAMAKSGLARTADGHVFFTLVFSFVWMETFFYPFHRLLHHPKLFFIHRAHHTARVPSPMTAMTFWWVERALILSCFGAGILAVSFVYPVSFYGIAIYFALNHVHNLIGHTNIEVFPPQWRWLISWCSTTSHHALHHARIKGHYGFHTRLFDYLFGTEFPDYFEVHQRAYQGEGLKSLGERVTPEPQPQAFNENRKQARNPLHCMVRFGSGATSTDSGVTLDLSPDGAAVYSRASLDTSRELRIEIVRPGDQLPITMRAKVRSLQPYRDGYRYGLKFEGVERRSRHRLQALYEERPQMHAVS